MSNPTYPIGIFGGAFDPVHGDHIALMRLAIEQLGLRTLVLVPSGYAPHKVTGTPYVHRLEMLRLATAGLPVEIDEIERNWPSTTYSSDILPALEAKYGPIVHIIGGDSLCNISHWHLPQEVLRYPHAVVARGVPDANLLNAIQEVQAKYSANVTLLCGHAGTCSSTAIRLAYRVGLIPHVREVDLGLLSQYGVAPSVHRYIVQNDLYNEYARYLREVPILISAERWAHSQQVAMFAATLNRQLGLPEDKVLTAALLHDCQKGVPYDQSLLPADAVGYPAVAHSFVGADYAQRHFGVEDLDILNAIRYHTTGRPAMSPLEKLIYLADLAEPTRPYDVSTRVREVALADFEQGFQMAVEETMQHLQQKQTPICPLGEACYQYYTRSKL